MVDYYINYLGLDNPRPCTFAHPTPPRDLPWPVRLGWRLYHLAWWPQRLLLNRADAVVTVSETTRAPTCGMRTSRR